MAKVKISEFDVNPDNNTDINSINIAEGCAPSGINNAIRQLMSDLKAFQTGADGDPFNGAINGTVGATTPSTGAFTTLSASSTVSGTGFSTYLASPPAIGGTAAAAGAFTSLSASGAFSANGGATLGDASGDALTINSSAVSIPNGLNFDSNTFVIDAAANYVGIATSTPTQRLQIGDGTGRTFTINQSTQNITRLINDRGISLESNNGYDTNIISAGTSSNGNITFSTNSSERMRITSAGNVGIGTSSPARTLHVSKDDSGGVFTSAAILSSSTNSALVQASINNTSTDANPEAGLLLQSGSSAASQWSITNQKTADNLGALIFRSRTAGGTSAERMRLDSSGNLGLGVTPSAWTSTFKAFQLGGTYPTIVSANAYQQVGTNFYNAGAGYIYTSSAFASRYTQIDGVHAWHTAPSGTAGNAITFTQAMTLDASGRLGIGTTSPIQPLDVRTASGTNPQIVWGRSGSVYSSLFADQFGTTTISADVDNAGASSSLRFAVDGTERMRIDSSGYLLVGTSAVNEAGGRVQIRFDGSTINGLNIKTTYASTGSYYAIFVNSAGAAAGYISQNGTTTVNYVTSSDYRLKENVAPITNALSRVSQLKPVTYTWKNTDGEQGEGFIAHELAEVAPLAVSGEKDAVDAEGNIKAQGIDTSKLVALLTSAIQEQQAIINDLKARIETLESK
jgi:hypothetical protein